MVSWKNHRQSAISKFITGSVRHSENKGYLRRDNAQFRLSMVIRMYEPLLNPLPYIERYH